MADSQELPFKTVIQRGVLIVINNGDTGQRVNPVGDTSNRSDLTTTNTLHTDPRPEVLLSSRPGAIDDQQIMYQIFGTDENLGFHYLNPSQTRNLFISDWDHRFPRNDGPEKSPPLNCPCLRCKIEQYDFTHHDALVLAVSTHGKESSSPGHSGDVMLQFMDGHLLPASEIFHVLTGSNIRGLQGKPKILFLQACRSDPDNPGKALDKGVEVKLLVNTGEQPSRLETAGLQETGSSNMGDATNAGGWKARGNEPINPLQQPAGDAPNAGREDRDSNMPDIPYLDSPTVESVPAPPPPVPQRTRFQPLQLPDDFVAVYPTTDGRYSYRSVGEASWMEQEMRDVFQAYKDSGDTELDLFDFLTEVAAGVAKRESLVTHDSAKSGGKNALCVMHRVATKIVFKKSKAFESQQEDMDVTPAL